MEKKGSWAYIPSMRFARDKHKLQTLAFFLSESGFEKVQSNPTLDRQDPGVGKTERVAYNLRKRRTSCPITSDGYF